MIHHCVLAPVVFAFFEIGIASVICRLIKRIKTRDKAIKVLLRKETVLLVIGGGLFTLFFWELGHFYYYTFLNLYLKLFG